MSAVLEAMTRRVIRVDGSTERLVNPVRTSEIERLIGADGLDVVQLRHLGPAGWVMVVDDTALIDGKPVNSAATALYHANCRPGTTNPICGDVVIVLDGDFA